MIIISDKPGQLGNQLWSFSNVIAISKSLGVKLIVVFNKDYYLQFDKNRLNFASESGIYIFSSHAWKGKLIARLVFILRNSSFFKVFSKSLKLPVSFNSNPVIDYRYFSKRRHLFFVDSWMQRENRDCFLQNHFFIRAIFEPVKEIKEDANRLILNLKRKYPDDILIGLHIRRGDYKFFEGGKYYFDDFAITKIMIEVERIFNHTSVIFFIFSNEKISIDNYSNHRVFFQDGQSPVSDLWTMSNCDYIIGPPSTFSMWASFWNNTPICFIYSPNEDLNMDKFRPFIAQDIQL